MTRRGGGSRCFKSAPLARHLAAQQVYPHTVRRGLLLLLLLLALGALAAGCGGDDDGDSDGATPSAQASCDKDNLELVNPPGLTVGTDNPAFPPWFGGGTPKGSTWEINDPSTGDGFESAVAYAVAQDLGFQQTDVSWVVVPFNQSFKPGLKDFDFDINQISITPARAKAVDFSESYYDVNQALVALDGTPITKAKSLADLKPYKLGAQIGTTSYSYITDTIKPSKDPSVYDTNNDVISALKAKQIDGLVVDLPTAFFVTAAQLEGSTIVGQFPAAGAQERFGMVFAKGNTLRDCVNEALTRLKADGQLEKIQAEWLTTRAEAPVIK
jgi:polar amino acid transport system substrate-binding protein